MGIKKERCCTSLFCIIFFVVDGVSSKRMSDVRSWILVCLSRADEGQDIGSKAKPISSFPRHALFTPVRAGFGTWAWMRGD